MIRKTGKGWTVLSKSGKPMGTYKTQAEAVRRIRQIEYWKQERR